MMVSSEPVDLQQHLQQPRAVRLRLGYCHASVSILSLYLTVISRFATSTYKHPERTENPCVGGSNPPLPICNLLRTQHLRSTYT